MIFFVTSYTLYNLWNDFSYANESLLSWEVNSWDQQILSWEINSWDQQTQTQSSLTCNGDWFSSLISWWNIYSWSILISWQISDACANENIILQLYDHNQQWIPLITLPWNQTWFTFNSLSLLSWFYDQIWTGDNWEPIIISQGLYTWVSTGSWDHYRLKWVTNSGIVLFETAEFSIDNMAPQISQIQVSSWTLSSWTVGIWKTLTIIFTSTEQLTWVSVLVWQTWLANFTNVLGTNYTYSYTLKNTDLQWYIPYTISFMDRAMHTWAITWLSQLWFDANYPQLTSFALSGYDFSFVSSESIQATSFVLIKNTTSWWLFNMTWLATWQYFSLPTLSLNTDYDMWIIAKDLAGNESKAAFSLSRTQSWSISFVLLAIAYGDTVITYSSGTNFLTQTWTQLSWTQQSSILPQFKDVINEFTECKKEIQHFTIEIQLKGNPLLIYMPKFQNNQIKSLVNSFIVYSLKQLENKNLQKNNLNDITSEFNTFLDILKLVNDDDSVCKQNLSNYHRQQFEESLKLYWIKF